MNDNFTIYEKATCGKIEYIRRGYFNKCGKLFKSYFECISDIKEKLLTGLYALVALVINTAALPLIPLLVVPFLLKERSKQKRQWYDLHETDQQRYYDNYINKKSNGASELPSHKTKENK
jgi:hypothetical protein